MNSLKVKLNREVDIKIKEEFDGFDPFADGEIDDSMGDDISKIIDSLRDEDEDEIANLPIDEKSDVKDPLTYIFKDEPKSQIKSVSETKAERKMISLFDVIDTSPDSENFQSFVKTCTVNVERLPDNKIAIFKLALVADFKRKRKRKADEEPSDKNPNKKAKVKENLQRKNIIPKKPETKNKKQKNEKKIIIVKASIPPEVVLNKIPKVKQTIKQRNSRHHQSNNKNQTKKSKEKKVKINGLKTKIVGDDFPVRSKKNPVKKPATNGKLRHESSSSDDEDSSVDYDLPMKDFRVVSESSTPLKSILSNQRKSQKTKKSVSFYHETFVKHFVPEAEDCIEITSS